MKLEKRIDLLEKRVAELEGQVQEQPDEKLKPKDDLGDLKHLFAGVKTYPPLL